MLFNSQPSSFDPKTPVDVIPYAFNFSDWLPYDPITGIQDRIASATITATSGDGELVIADVTVVGPLVVATVSAGTINTSYDLSCVISTSGGLVAQADEMLSVAASVR